MNWGIKFAGMTMLAGCLFLAGCLDKSTTPPAGESSNAENAGEKPAAKPADKALPKPTAEPIDVSVAASLLEKNNGSLEKNAAGAVVAVTLTLNKALDPASEEDKAAGKTVADTEYNKSVGELFDAINKLTDLEKVTFSGPGVDDFGVTRLTNLKNVKTAHFKNTNIAIASLEKLGETMPELTDLSVNRCLKLDGKSLKAIANGMPKLKILDLQSNAFKTFDLRVLPNLPALEQLDLRQCTSVEGEALKYVADIKTLKVLRLRGASYRDSSIQHLAGHPALRALFLQDANVSDECLDYIKDIPELVDLSLFRLLDITNDGLKKLEGTKLQRLLIRDNDLINDEGLAVLKSMTDLNRLTLYEVRSVTDEGLIAAISGNKKLINLALYDMESITDESRKALATTTALRSLELRKTKQTDATLELAAKLPKLETIIIGDNNEFTDKGLNALGESKSLKKIEIMNITGVSEKGIAEFRAKHPKIALSTGGTGEHE